MPRASADDRVAHAAEVLRTLASELKALADGLTTPDESPEGLVLGPDDELTAEDQARVDSAVARFRQRSKQARHGQRTRAQRRPPKGNQTEPQRQGGTP